MYLIWLALITTIVQYILLQQNVTFLWKWMKRRVVPLITKTIYNVGYFVSVVRRVEPLFTRLKILNRYEKV